MNKIYFTHKELQELGFEFVEDGDTFYGQLVLSADDYLNSPYLCTEDINTETNDNLRVSAGGDEGNWLGEEELLAIIKRGYL